MAGNRTEPTPPIVRFLHCRQCVLAPGKSARIEVGLTASGIRIDCKKHGLVGHLTPDGIEGMIANMPACACCPGGKHLS